MDTDKTVTTEEVVQQPAKEAPAADSANEGSTAAPRAERTERFDRSDRRPNNRMNNRRRKKVCMFCEDKIDYLDYKDTVRLKKFISERGKILPRRISGACSKHQRQLTVAIKRARVVALMPYISD